MAKASSINQWLSAPNSFLQSDEAELSNILDKYPYFSPGQYVHAAQKQRQQAFQNSILEKMQLFQGNWILFIEYLNSCETLEQPIIAQIEEHGLDIPLVISDAPIEETTVVNEATTTTHETPELPTTNIQELPPVMETVSVESVSVEALPIEMPAPEIMDHVQPEEMLVQPAATIQIPEPVVEKEIIETAETIVVKEAEKPIIEDQKPVKKKSNSINEEMGKPIFSEDYFLYQGIEIPEVANMRREPVKEDKSLMIVMSFSEWLMHFKTKNERDKQDKEDKKALKTMWQKEKLAAALEEENEEIPEEVFNMAVNSITKEDGLASESLAEILQKQGKFDKALDMYRKLSLRNPQKSAYFATKIEQINKQLEL